MNNTLDFSDITTTEVAVKVGSKSYTLKEASGHAVCVWRNAVLKCTKLGPEGKPESIGPMADTEPLLVSLCLYDEKGKSVAVQTVRSWPNRVQKALFDRLKEISDLNEQEDTEDTLNKQIEQLQERLNTLRSLSSKNSGEEGEGSDPTIDGPESTTDG